MWAHFLGDHTDTTVWKYVWVRHWDDCRFLNNLETISQILALQTKERLTFVLCFSYEINNNKTDRNKLINEKARLTHFWPRLPFYTPCVRGYKMRTLTINGLTRYCQWRVLWTLGKNGLMTHSFRDSAAHSEPSPTSKAERFCNNCFHKRLQLDIWLGPVNGELFVRMLPVLSILSSRQRHYNVSAK